MTNRITLAQLDEYQSLYRRLTNIDNRIYCQHLLKTYGVQVATNYARIILNPIHKRAPVFNRNYKNFHPIKKHGKKLQR